MSITEQRQELQPANCVWDVSPDEYFRDNTKVSNSGLSILKESPALYKGVVIDGTIPREEHTASTRLGSMKHIACLQPELFDHYVEIIPAEVLAKNGAKSTNEYKAWAADRTDKILAKAGELDTVRRMMDSLHAHSIAGPLIREAGPCEQALTWIDEDTGLACKCLRDKVVRSGSIIIDLKTCADPSPQAFSKSCANFSYYRQAAWYLQGHAEVFGEDAIGMLFIAIGKDAPHDVAVYELDYDAIELGRKHAKELLSRLAKCLETGNWTAPHQRLITTIRLPVWADSEKNWSLE